MAEARPSSILHPRSSILVLLALSLVLLLARLRSYHEPPEWDIGTYLAIAREMLAGERLYADAWDVKPPAIFVTFAAAQFFAGDGALAVYLLSVTAAVATMVGVYAAASTATRRAGVLAALFWVAMCYAPRAGGNLPNTEVFINAAVAWGLALWLRAPLGEMRWGRCIAIGLLLAVASFYKQVAVVILACVAAAELLFTWLGRPARAIERGDGEHARAGRPSPVGGLIAKLIVMLAVILLAWAAVLGYFAASGRGWLAWQTFFVAPRAYSGGMLGNLVASLWPQKMFSGHLVFALPALALTLTGVAVAIRRRNDAIVPPRAWILLAGLFVGAHLAVALPGQFHWHYYQLWFVPLSIGGGWGAAAVIERLGRRRKVLAYAIVGLALGAMVAPQADWYALDGRGWARRKYGDFFIDAHDAFLAAGRQLPPGATFYTWSDEAYAYSITARRPPATALWKMHTTTGPLADWLTRRTLEELDRSQPAMVILYGQGPTPADHPIARWIDRNYERVPDERRRHFPLTFYRPRGASDAAPSSRGER